MTTRTAGHRQESRSIRYVEGIFDDLGWTVERIKHDYGEDLLVKVFMENDATEHVFLVQVKSTTKLSRYLKDKQIHFPIKQVSVWNQMIIPVILVVYDDNANCAYWECIQTLSGDAQLPTESQRKK